jgi:hypothetical protein
MMMMLVMMVMMIMTLRTCYGSCNARTTHFRASLRAARSVVLHTKHERAPSATTELSSWPRHRLLVRDGQGSQCC